MRAIAQWLVGVDRAANAASARSARTLGDSELDQVAAAGGPRSAGAGSGGGNLGSTLRGSDWPPPPYVN
jgi:hypothetical protein